MINKSSVAQLNIEGQYFSSFNAFYNVAFLKLLAFVEQNKTNTLKMYLSTKKTLT
jgi:hypothetical protein